VRPENKGSGAAAHAAAVVQAMIMIIRYYDKRIVVWNVFQMNMTCAKRKDDVQEDVEHAILRPKTLTVFNV